MKPGISNRESADQEARERKEHPPLNTNLPPEETIAGATENPADSVKLAARETTARITEGLQTSEKAGVRSMAQKESQSRYPDRPAPSARKVAGAFGKERKRRAKTT